MRLHRFAATALVAMGCLASSSAWAQAIPEDTKKSSELFDINAQYRTRMMRIEPLELSGTQARQTNWIEQRLRLDGSLSQPKVGSLTFQIDALDGVLFGDNGSFFGTPRSNSGVSLSSKKPNLTRWTVGLRDGDDVDQLDPDNYVPVLEAAPLLDINYLYADVILPVGLLRVGRQPFNYGSGIAGNDGGRHNRFGVSQYGDAVDRILLGTKLDEAVKMLTTEGHSIDTSLDNGVIFGVFYDLLKQDRIQSRSDNLRQTGFTLDYRKKNADWLGFDWRDVRLGGSAVFLKNDLYNTSIVGLPVTLEAHMSSLHVKLQYIHTRGETEEISQGFAALSSSDPSSQLLRAHGAQAIADLDLGRVTLTMEFDYATGDSDPRSTNPITSFSFARDMNVGVLLFEHIMAFESARSVAVGVENLSATDIDVFPLTEVRTDGRFTNAVALFPQAYIDIIKNDKNRLWLRTGVLFAWPEDGGVVDPILTTLRTDGEEIADDAVNYHGGAPGNYYGTEFDLQLGWRVKEHFDWMLEGALLVPGSSLQDANGHATNTYLLENRFVFSF